MDNCFVKASESYKKSYEFALRSFVNLHPEDYKLSIHKHSFYLSTSIRARCFYSSVFSWQSFRVDMFVGFLKARRKRQSSEVF